MHTKNKNRRIWQQAKREKVDYIPSSLTRDSRMLQKPALDIFHNLAMLWMQRVQSFLPVVFLSPSSCLFHPKFISNSPLVFHLLVTFLLSPLLSLILQYSALLQGITRVGWKHQQWNGGFEFILRTHHVAALCFSCFVLSLFFILAPTVTVCHSFIHSLAHSLIHSFPHPSIFSPQGLLLFHPPFLFPPIYPTIEMLTILQLATVIKIKSNIHF